MRCGRWFGCGGAFVVLFGFLLDLVSSTLRGWIVLGCYLSVVVGLNWFDCVDCLVMVLVILATVW